ncbi:FAD-dependent oxidoreductase [Sphingomonas crocodyli]|uniref:FAD-binding domain-containing protein n=1 Tax=Sphingomonas crocodyli TaxID=1979270 RepID=A0A437LZY3_9SPHN|nr:FAD-dependent monooxygenase [Sphingomonas crocodyli]RVT90988.1 hypothetical protein EOD43_15765 [Sphingomonas crocodyli]
MAAAPVIIVGAGPSGLTAAFFLVRAGVPVLMLERGDRIYDDPRAATIHPPTLEMFADSGITAKILEKGIVARYWQFRGLKEGQVALFDLDLLSDTTGFPYRVQCEQHRLSRILYAELEKSPDFEIRWSTPADAVTQDADGVTVTAGAESFRASYVIGADGGRSVVRKSQEIGFEGFTYPERFLVITTTHDFEPEGFSYSNYLSDPDRWAAIFKVPGDRPAGLWRVTSPTTPDEREEDLLDFAQAEERLQKLLPKEGGYEIVHTNLYAVHQRVAETFRKGRVLLIGDAAHVNNPLGGMGMNFGIHDAVSVSAKLAAVIKGEANDALLDLFDRQRRHAAQAFLQFQTIQNKQVLEEKDPVQRGKRLDDMRAAATDPVRAHAHMMKTSMIEGVRVVAAIE